MQEKEKAKRLQSEPDEEGWVTIGKGGRKPGASKVEAAELLDKKKKKKQKVALIFKTISVRKMTKRSNVKGGGGGMGSHMSLHYIKLTKPLDEPGGGIANQWVRAFVLKGLFNVPLLNRFFEITLLRG